MYERFFGLRERPFELGSDLRYLFLPASHREALSNLQYGIASRKGVTVLTGEVGTGKTTMVRAAMAQAEASSLCVHVTNPRLTRDEFFQFLAEGFKLDRAAGTSKVACLAALEERLIARLNRGEHSTLIIDEVQSVSDEVLEEVRLLTNMELRDGTRLLSIILVGQPEFGERLNSEHLRHLKQRVALRCELRALQLHEAAGFIAARIRVAGGVAANVFTREAVQLIHEASGGIPRVLSVLCDNALVSGYAANERPVDSRTVREVCADFHITAPAQGDERPPAAIQPITPASHTAVRLKPPAVHGQPARVLRAEFQAPPAEAAASDEEPARAGEVTAAADRPLFATPAKRRWFGVFEKRS